jgi:hypothetical protein
MRDNETERVRERRDNIEKQREKETVKERDK